MRPLRQIIGNNAIYASIHLDDAMTNESEGPWSPKVTPEIQQLHSDLSANFYKVKHSPTEQHLMRDYTDHGHNGKNSYLWNKHEYEKRGSVYDAPAMNKEISILQKAIKKHKLPQNLTLWSSTSHDPQKLKNEKGIVHHPAFLSTSINPEVAFNREINAIDSPNKFTSHHHILKINAKEGQRGAYIQPISKYDYEKEVLLPKGLNLKHIKTNTSQAKFGDITKFTHIHEMDII